MATTLLTIPTTKAYHLPPGAPPILLAQGDLALRLIPAHLPDHPRETITLSVGGAAFPLTRETPVVKTDTTAQHASYLFRPRMGDHAGGGVGKVKITLKESTGPDEYERTEAHAQALEGTLRALGCWHDQDYYELEDEADAAAAGEGYGTTIADTLTSYGKWIAHRLEALAHPAAAPEAVSHTAQQEKAGSTTAATAHGATESLSEAVHEGARYLGALAGEAYKSIHDVVAPPVGEGNTAPIAGEGAVVGAGNAGAGNAGAGNAGAGTWEEVTLSTTTRGYVPRPPSSFAAC